MLQYLLLSAMIIILAQDDVYLHASKFNASNKNEMSTTATTVHNDEKTKIDNNVTMNPNLKCTIKNFNCNTRESKISTKNNSLLYKNTKQDLDFLRRFTQNNKTLTKELLLVRPPTDEMQSDCLREDRKNLRFTPFDCYSKTWDDWSFKGEFWPFMKEIFNEMRFTFDFVLYDNTQNKTRKECKFWYLMYYLRSIVEDIKNPTDIIRTVNGESLHYCNSTEVEIEYKNAKDIQSESFSVLTRTIAMTIKAIAAVIKAMKSMFG